MTTVSFPPRCAVAMICGEHLIAQVYPAAVPVEAFLDDVVALLDDELKRRGGSGLDPGSGYELQRTNGTRLDVTKTLDELGIEDGNALVLAPARAGDPFEPHYESLSTGLARLGKTLFPPVSPVTAAHTALAILAMAVAGVVLLALRTRAAGPTILPTLVTGVAGVTAAVVAVAVIRWWPRRTDLLVGFGWPAIVLLPVAAGMAAPGPLGSPHVVIAGLTAVVLAGMLVAGTGIQVTPATAVVTLCGLVTVVAFVRMWRPVPMPWLAMGTLVALLVLLTMAPTFALWAARIRPPHFGSITGRDLFRRADGMPVDAVAPVDEAADSDGAEPPDPTPSGPDIAAAAQRANRALTGICIGAATALPVAVWATLTPGRPKEWAAAAVAILFVVIFISRARSFADRRQAVALVLGAAAAWSAGVARYALSGPAESGAALVCAALVLTAFAVGALVAGLLVPVTRFTPLVRMLTEWLELVAIVAVLPLAAWTAGLFAWVRMR